MEQQLQHLAERQALTEEELHSIREILEDLRNTTKELKDLLEIYKSFKLATKVFGWIEKSSVFVAKVAGAVAVLWASWRYVISETIDQIVKK